MEEISCVYLHWCSCVCLALDSRRAVKLFTTETISLAIITCSCCKWLYNVVMFSHSMCGPYYITLLLYFSRSLGSMNVCCCFFQLELELFNMLMVWYLFLPKWERSIKPVFYFHPCSIFRLVHNNWEWAWVWICVSSHKQFAGLIRSKKHSLMHVC